MDHGPAWRAEEDARGALNRLRKVDAERHRGAAAHRCALDAAHAEAKRRFLDYMQRLSSTIAASGETRGTTATTVSLAAAVRLCEDYDLHSFEGRVFIRPTDGAIRVHDDGLDVGALRRWYRSRGSERALSEEELIAESFRLGEIAAARVTQYFNDHNELECEKASLPYLLFGKKTYAARVFEHPAAKPKLDVKGLAVVRRDTCDFVARALESTLQALVMERSVQCARKVVRDCLERLVSNEVPMQELTLSKRLSGTYANPNLPHLTVVRKMEARNPGSAPKSGDRVPYVLIETADRRAKVFEKAEDPRYVRERGLRVDRRHYLTNQLIKPLTQLFSPFDADPSRMFTATLQELERQQSNQRTLMCFGGGDDASEARTAEVGSEAVAVVKKKAPVAGGALYGGQRTLAAFGRVREADVLPATKRLRGAREGPQAGAKAAPLKARLLTEFSGGVK